MSAARHDQARLDHLVVLADTLEHGAAWCEATLGVAPGPGGKHPLFGTHNLLLPLSSEGFPLSYLEIIAIDPEANFQNSTPTIARNRWFDMDDATLREQVRTHGPQLIHWVARVPDVQAAVDRLAARGIDRGNVLAASRDTPLGLLEWKIAVRPDGQRLMDGCLPTLIEWGAAHPAASMPAAGLALAALRLAHPQADALREACAAVGLEGIAIENGSPALAATLRSSRGVHRLSSR